MTTSWRRVWQGVAFLAVLAVMVGFSVASFQQRFVDVVPVTLKVERAGTQLEKNADVKLRGIVVGRVAKQRTTGRGAELELALHPDKTSLIPGNVVARILPKTLFGEKYVDLVLPRNAAAAPPIRAGDVIPEDRSEAALEVERVLADLFPLLRDLQPEKLNRALTAIADGLRDQGEALGANLAAVDRYLAQFNAELPTLQRDLSGLADLAESFDDSADDLLRLARNAVTSAQTLTEKEDAFASFLRGTAGFADTTTAILNRDGDNLVELARTSRPILAAIFEKRGVLPRTVTGLRTLVTELNDALDAGPALNIRLEIVPNRGIYTAPCRYPNCNEDESSTAPSSVGSPEEREVLRTLIGPVLGVPKDEVPDVADVLFGPLLRGSEVSMR